MKIEKLAITVAISVFALTLVIPTGLAILLRKYATMDRSLAQALPFMALSQALIVFISIAMLLKHVKFLNTDIGRLTMSAAMFVDIAGFTFTVIIFVALQNQSGSFLTLAGLLQFIVARRDSKIGVTTLVIVKLQGRPRPILVDNQNQPHHDLRSMSCNASHIDNALRQYGQQNERCVSVQSFTSISTFETMYGDICRISLDSGSNILILLFHKRWVSDDTVEISHRTIQTMNINVLQTAPCLVGILVDKSMFNPSPSLLMARASFYVAVFFIGGQDVMETLAYATRMGRHQCVYVTVVRFLLFGEENSKDRKRDGNLIDEYRYYKARNDEMKKEGATFNVQLVMDECKTFFFVGHETTALLLTWTTMLLASNPYWQDKVRLEVKELFKGEIPSVDQLSKLTLGHDEWSECEELGVIGDMLPSPNFVTKASLLVVQQQRIRGRREMLGVSEKDVASCVTGNPIDDCWKCDPDWANNRQRLADGAIGFGQN
ncbi:Cation/H(+) antiporter 14 [Glycine soja]|nr:Cation/H(+) antiporter 14 [Glycine soja]